MEAAPSHIDGRRVQAALAGVEGVEQVHDLHIWTITRGFDSLSAHVRVSGRDRDELLAELRQLIRERFHIEHTTLQLEASDLCENGPCD